MTKFGEWQPIETAPYQEVIEVKNSKMRKPILATRGYSYDGMVHKDDTFCTSVYTPDEFGGYPAGRLVCPTHWRYPLPEPPQ